MRLTRWNAGPKDEKHPDPCGGSHSERPCVCLMNTMTARLESCPVWLEMEVTNTAAQVSGRMKPRKYWLTFSVLQCIIIHGSIGESSTRKTAQAIEGMHHEFEINQ